MSATLDHPNTTTVVASPAPPTLTPERAIELYIALRDRKTAMEEAHKAATKPVTDAMARLEATLLAHLDQAGVEHMGAKAGTAYKTVRTSCTVSAWSATLDYIRDNELWELLEARVSKTVALAIMEETKQPIPGVAVRRELAVNVRRAS